MVHGEMLLASYSSVLKKYNGRNYIYLSKTPYTKIYSAIYTKKGSTWQHNLSKIILQ